MLPNPKNVAVLRHQGNIRLLASLPQGWKHCLDSLALISVLLLFFLAFSTFHLPSILFYSGAPLTFPPRKAGLDWDKFIPVSPHTAADVDINLFYPEPSVLSSKRITWVCCSHTGGSGYSGLKRNNKFHIVLLLLFSFGFFEILSALFAVALVFLWEQIDLSLMANRPGRWRNTRTHAAAEGCGTLHSDKPEDKRNRKWPLNCA